MRVPGTVGGEMSISRRSFLLGAASGASVLVLAACTDSTPTPSPSPTTPAPVGELPEPSSFQRTRWSNDPYALGATSYLAVGTLPQSRDVLAQPVLDRLVFAGEAVSDAPGTVSGAIASGRLAADRLADVLGDGERIAVIGAGAAGAAAARALVSRGADVIVVEARNRTGGRIDSKVEGGDTYFELGAWRLNEGDDADVIDDLAREDIGVDPLGGGSLYALDGTEDVSELDAEDPALLAAGNALGPAVAWAQGQPQDVSVAEALQGSGQPESWPAAADAAVTSETLAGQVLAAVSGLTGAPADELGSWFLPPISEEQSVIPNGPLSTFVDVALDGITTVLSAAVVGVAYDEDGVSLRLAAGESIRVDRVVVTVPLGVLKTSTIEFDPPLPVSHRAAINALAVGHLELVRLEFDTPFWETDAVWWVNEQDDVPIRLWVNLLPATGRPVLLGIASGTDAVDLAQADDAAVRTTALTSLEPFGRSAV